MSADGTEYRTRCASCGRVWRQPVGHRDGPRAGELGPARLGSFALDATENLIPACVACVACAGSSVAI